VGGRFHATAVFLTVSLIEPVPDLSPILYERGGKRGLSLHSHLDPPLSEEIIRRLTRPHRSSHYFLLFVGKGVVHYSVDMQEVPVAAGEALFVRPQQIRVPPREKSDAEYFKITFDEVCYSRLPRTYKFWLDPWDERRIRLPPDARDRLVRVFELLRLSLQVEDGGASLMIAYLNTVMSELERAYFAATQRRMSSRNVTTFLGFQELIEEEFRSQPLVSELAQTLAVSDSALYAVVKEFAGVPPKEYLNRRIALEAQRLLSYAQISVKELASQLGFDDENYFCRFFRKRTGKSVSEFQSALQDLSRTPADSSLTSTWTG